VLLGLLRAERLKLTSTRTWWAFAIALIPTTAVALLLSVGTTDDALHHGGKGAPVGGFADVTRAPAELVATFAANIFTSGQFFGCLFALLLGILLMTNEYHHQTATTTFLVTPHRTVVVLGKFLAAILAGGAIWAYLTLLDLAVGTYYFSTQNLASPLGSWTVQRAVLVNLMVFALWSVFGLGLGVLLRAQVAATVTAAVGYVLGPYGALAVVALVRAYVYRHDIVYQALVLYPAYAAQVAASPGNTDLPDGVHSLPWWSGALVLLAYAAATITLGTHLLRHRDIT
jgi:ABC-2 type transport system permease protein